MESKPNKLLKKSNDFQVIKQVKSQISCEINCAKRLICLTNGKQIKSYILNYIFNLVTKKISKLYRFLINLIRFLVEETINFKFFMYLKYFGFQLLQNVYLKILIFNVHKV